jgi:hypothetical protein
MMKSNPNPQSNWRSIRAYKVKLSQDVIQKHSLRWHAFWIGSLTLITALVGAAVLKSSWPDGWLSLRYALVLSFAYLIYLLLIRLWAGYMARRSRSDSSGDVPSPDGISGGSGGTGGCKSPNEFSSGKGGDFGGGGAHGDFDIAGSDVSSSAGDVTSAGLEVAASADEAAVVIVPVVAVFAGLVFLIGAGGWMVSLLFGIEVLLAVTVELAFAMVASRTLFQMGQQSWWETAVSLSWKPMLGSMLLAVAFGAVIDIWFPQANSLFDFTKLIQQR